MKTLAYVMILAAIIITRQTLKGRALNLTEDIPDAFLALAQGNQKALAAVFARSGDSATVSAPSESELNTGDATGSPATGLAAAAIELGSKASGYGWAMAGPNRYDCSGLMYRALQRIGYKGPRFITSTLLSQQGMTKTSTLTVGDMVLWLPGQGGVTGHVGVVTGADEFYSARSVKSGIGYSKISTARSVKPTYVRWVKS